MFELHLEFYKIFILFKKKTIKTESLFINSPMIKEIITDPCCTQYKKYGSFTPLAIHLMR